MPQLKIVVELPHYPMVGHQMDTETWQEQGSAWRVTVKRLKINIASFFANVPGLKSKWEAPVERGKISTRVRVHQLDRHQLEARRINQSLKITTWNPPPATDKQETEKVKKKATRDK